MLRSFLAIAAGFLFTGIGINAALPVLRSAWPDLFLRPPARIEDPVVLLILSALVGFFAILGCWLTARLAPARPMQHALMLGAIAFAMSIPGAISAWEQAPAWAHLLNLTLVMPFAWIGGKLRQSQLDEA